MIEIIAIVITYVWVRVDDSGWYDPHEMPAQFFRWMVFLVTAGVVANFYAWGRVLAYTDELNYFITLGFVKIIAIRGALFNLIWNIRKGYKNLLYAKGTIYDKWWYPIGWLLGYIALLLWSIYTP